MRKRWGLKARPVYQACLADLTRVARPLLPRGFKTREEVEAFLVAQSGQTAAGLRDALSAKLGKKVTLVTAYNLARSYRLKFRVKPEPRGPRLDHESSLGPNRTIFMVTGPSGSGKSWVCRQLLDQVHYVDYDKTAESRRAAALAAATFQERPILFDPVSRVASYINRNPALKFRLACIVEPPEVILQRLQGRGSDMAELTPGILKRVDRTLAYSRRYAEFSGSSDQVLAWLRSQLST